MLEYQEVYPLTVHTHLRTGGGGGLNGTIIPYSTAIVSDPQNEGSKIASASSIYKLHSRISAIETNIATSIAVTGTGNAITSVSKNGTSITFTKGSTFLTSHQSLVNCVQTVTTTGTGNAVTAIDKLGSTITVTKGATFLTSHQSLADYLTKSEASSTYQPKGNYLTSHQSLSNYYTKSQVDSIANGKSSTSHTHSVIINGTTKIIAASGGTAVNLGNYLTSHQSLADYAKKSEIPTKVSQLTNDTGYITSSGSCAYATSAGNADTVDGVHVTWAGEIVNTRWLAAWENDGSALRAINPANVSVGNADKLDGIHANGLLTAISNSDKGISITVGGTTKSVSNISVNYASSAGNADTLDGEHGIGYVRTRVNLYSTPNDIAKNVGGYIGMIINNSSDNFPEGKNSDWHHIISANYNNSPDGSGNDGNYWCSQLINKAGSNKLYIRSRNGGNDITTGWTSWEQLARVTDNVASATKLATARTIWGQSFDGTADISISAAAKMPFVLFKRFDNDENAGYIGCGSSSNNNIYIESYVNSNIILGLNSNVGIGDTSPGYKLCVSGDIYATDAIRSSKKNQAIVLSNFSSPAWISALDGQVIFNTGNAIRFGETAWDWNQWAGLKYTHSNKTIYLGIAENSAFNANSAQSDGTLRLAGIKTVTPDSGARIGNTGGDLYLGNSNNSAWVKVQDMCSQADTNNWRIYQNGGAAFNALTINGGSTFNGSSTFNGAVKVNNMLTAKAIMFTTANVNAFGTSVNNWDGSIGANVTNMFNGIDHNNISMEYSTNGGSSWLTYTANPNYLFNLINDNSDIENFYLGNNDMSGNSDADKLAQIKKNQLRVTIKIPPEVYQELSWISVDVNNGVDIKCQVYFGNSSGVYREYVSKIMVGWSHRCDICVGPLNVNVGNDNYRYVRLVFSHLSSHTALRNGIVSRIRALALTKYSNPSGRYNISTTGHIYTFDYNMNTYFPNSILAAGGVTAYQSSDIRLKTNITKLNCLNVIKSIGGTYEFDYLRDHKHSIGFIAQHVNNPLLKDIVAKDKDGYLKINYWSPKLISLAFGALTEIDNEVDRLKARVRELETEVEYLKNKDYVLQ